MYFEVFTPQSTINLGIVRYSGRKGTVLDQMLSHYWV